MFFYHLFSDTVSRCGIFCALINAIERYKTEGLVDVFQAVKALRIQKPGSVPTVVCKKKCKIMPYNLSSEAAFIQTNISGEFLHYLHSPFFP